jgi:hypothetical protein
MSVGTSMDLSTLVLAGSFGGARRIYLRVLTLNIHMPDYKLSTIVIIKNRIKYIITCF